MNNNNNNNNNNENEHNNSINININNIRSICESNENTNSLINNEDIPNVSSILTSSIDVQRPSNHEQLIKPVINTNFLMNTNPSSFITNKEIKVEDEVVLTDPTNLLINDTSSVITPPHPKPVPAFSTKEEISNHFDPSYNPRKAYTLNCPINISTTSDNKVSSHYLNKNEKFIGIFNYIELPPTKINKSKDKSKSKRESKEDIHTNENQAIITDDTILTTKNKKENKICSSSLSFQLDDYNDTSKENRDRNNALIQNDNNNTNHDTADTTHSELFNKEEISKQIDKEFQKIQVQMKEDDLVVSVDDDITHDGLDSEISILSSYSPNNINILDQSGDIKLENAIPIQDAVVTQCTQSPLSISDDKHKATRDRARSHSHSINYLRNRSFSGKLGLGSFGLGLTNLTNLTENGELLITEDNAYLYNFEIEPSIDGISTISCNLNSK
jgi:hypothetical protein